MGQRGLQPGSAGTVVPPGFGATTTIKSLITSNQDKKVTGPDYEKGHDLRKPGGWICCCGTLVRTEKGLKIHRTKMGCKGEAKQRIAPDEGTSQSSEAISQVYNHRADCLSARSTPVEEIVDWPSMKCNEKWELFERGVLAKLGRLSGSLHDRFVRLSEKIYEEGKEVFGVKRRHANKVEKVGESRRQQLIKQLKREKNNLKKRWRRASEEEKPEINGLVEEARKRLLEVQRAERTAVKKRKRKQANEGFSRNPFGYAKTLVEEKKSGRLMANKEEIDKHLDKILGVEIRKQELGGIPQVERPTMPGKSFDVADIKFGEVWAVIRKARAKSSSGPNGVSYRVYKKCKELRTLLWRLLRRAWREGFVHGDWQVANGIFIPKEENAERMDQFRPIALLNVEGKIFFSVLARRIANFVMANGYVNTSIQKAGIPGFAGCLEHSTVIWEMIKRAKSQGGDLTVVWLDLVNAYGSVPHSLVKFALEFFWVPEKVIKVVEGYFKGFWVRYASAEATSSWHKLEVGIAMGCAVSPMLFVMVMEVMIRIGLTRSKGVTLERGVSVSSMKAFMDDITVVEERFEDAMGVIGKLDQAVEWGCMKFKPSKCRSLVIVRGKVKDSVVMVAGEEIPSVKQRGVKSLGRWYKYPVSDRARGKEFEKEVEDGLEKIDRSWLRGKWKCWCYHHVLLPKLLWPLLVYEIPLSKVEAMEKRINSFVRKWLGVPRCLSSVALYGRTTMLQLPFVSIVDEFKVGKVRLQLMLRESSDWATKLVEPELYAGKIWSVVEAVNEAESRVRFDEIKGNVQQGKSGLGWRRWTLLNEGHRQAVCQEVRSMQEEKRREKTAQLKSQGRSMGWEGVIERKLAWNDIWKMDMVRVGFLLKSVWDCLPTKRNLKLWKYVDSSKCERCGEQENLEHVLCACKPALAEGRYTWRHNRVLEVVAEILRENVMIDDDENKIRFVREGEVCQKGEKTGLKKGEEWEVMVDLKERLVFPQEIVITNLRPDMVLINRKLKKVVMVELTVPWEDRMGDAHTRKTSKYEALRQECEDGGWNAGCFAIEVGCRGFAGQSVRALFQARGIKGRRLRQALEKVAEAAEKASAWLWLKRGDVWKRGEMRN